MAFALEILRKFVLLTQKTKNSTFECMLKKKKKETEKEKEEEEEIISLPKKSQKTDIREPIP